MRYRTTVVAALAAGGLVLSGCASSEGGAEARPSTAVAAEAPAAFDPCTDIPQSVLDSEGLRNELRADDDGADGLQWRGCDWVQIDGYAASIQTTNLTVPMVRDKEFPDTREFDLAGRPAVSSRTSSDRTDECAVNVAIEGGSLEVGLTNPPSSKKTGQLDTCELARDLAAKVVAELPEGV